MLDLEKDVKREKPEQQDGDSGREGWK